MRCALHDPKTQALVLRPMDGVGIQRFLSKPPLKDKVLVKIHMGIPLEAVLDRSTVKSGIVTLTSRDVERHFMRDMPNAPGELRVSFLPSPDSVVPVETIMLSFRPENDDMTDGGTIWITPGSPAIACFYMFPRMFYRGRPTPAAIIAEAEAAIRTRILRKLVTQPSRS